MGIKTKIELEITTNNPFELKPKMEALIELSKLDNEVLLKLAELSRSPKAITQLKTNFPMIKGFLS
ncbi:hypothetical protein ACFX5D_04100 [Flavobacterium sp. LB3P45]|uniref:Uncharacterized protein n=1 Tax=Flavobacterium fructosi TaxID=3230416 RepID=A0ABW6HJG4_9FLAO